MRCRWCGDEFERPKQRQVKLFCSKSCQKANRAHEKWLGLSARPLAARDCRCEDPLVEADEDGRHCLLCGHDLPTPVRIPVTRTKTPMEGVGLG